MTLCMSVHTIRRRHQHALARSLRSHQNGSGADLVLLHPDGSEEVLVPGGDGSIVDPYVSFNGLWIYFVKFHNLQNNKLNMQRRQGGVPVLGSDIYKINEDARSRQAHV